MTQNEVADRLAIADKLYKYCRSVDRLDVPLGHSVFHEDSYADFPTYQGPGRGWIDAVCKEHLNFLHHSHQVTNVVIDLHGPDKAGSEAYVTAKLRQMVDGKLMEREFCARYVDLWSKRQGEWAIDRRSCLVDFSVLREVESLGQTAEAARDRADPSYQVLTSY
ncbi:MAG: nuclear transport factor 2 family protein [Novosphingobium sp.]